MLKNLLSTLIETVFTNKKSYIATQCLPNGVSIMQSYYTQTGSVVVPFNGWARVQSQCNSMQASFNECLVTVNNQDTNWPSIILPVKKGETLRWNVLDGFISQVDVWFIHNQTNE